MPICQNCTPTIGSPLAEGRELKFAETEGEYCQFLSPLAEGRELKYNVIHVSRRFETSPLAEGRELK